MTGAYTVREFLDAALDPHRRTADLDALADRFTGQPLLDTVTDLRDQLDQGIGMEDFRRMQILISHLYHQCGAGFRLTADLFAEVGDALARTTTAPERREPHVLSD